MRWLGRRCEPRRRGGGEVSGETARENRIITAEEFVTLLNTAWSRGRMREAHGTRFLSVGEGARATLQLSVSLVGNTDRGSLTVEAEIVHRGRSTLVIEVRVVDDRRRLIAKLVATQLAPVAPTVTAPAACPGR